MDTISLKRGAAASNLKTIFLTGLLVGSLDILTALIDYYITRGKNPLIVLKFIASGVLGKKALTGGTDMIAAGFLFHYIIAFSFTIFFFWLYPKLRILSRNRILTGIAYGIFIWCIMNFLVLPLSNIPSPITYKVSKVIKATLILIVMIGLPLSFIAYNMFHKKGTENTNKTKAL